MRIRPETSWLTASGVAFALFPMLRPWGDKAMTQEGMVAAFGSSWWLVAHLLGAGGFVALSVALALRARVERRGRAAAWFAAVGTALVLPFFGAETFALHAIALLEPGSTPALAEGVRGGAAALGTFALGLLCLAVAGDLIAATRRRASGLRWAGIPLALGLVGYLPQFFLPAEGRIAHGVLMLVGAVVLALAWRREAPVNESTPARHVPAGV